MSSYDNVQVSKFDSIGQTKFHLAKSVLGPAPAFDYISLGISINEDQARALVLDLQIALGDVQTEPIEAEVDAK